MRVASVPFEEVSGPVLPNPTQICLRYLPLVLESARENGKQQHDEQKDGDLSWTLREDDCRPLTQLHACWIVSALICGIVIQ